jgi:AcrR family transcriptional regulator
MGLREEKKARTRAALVGAAERLFAEKGYDGTTVADIAAAAGVSTRTFFGYFRAKEDVLFAGADERLATLAEAFGDGTADLGDIVERVLAASDDMAGPDRLAVLLDRPELRAQAMQRLIAAQRLIAGWLRRTYPERMDATLSGAAAGAVVGALVGAVLATDSGEDPSDRVRRALALIGAVLAG